MAALRLPGLGSAAVARALTLACALLALLALLRLVFLLVAGPAVPLQGSGFQALLEQCRTGVIDVLVA